MTTIVFTNAKLIPWLLLVVPSAAGILVYLLAVSLDHVKPFFPFVSHAAAYPPQAALFSSLIEVTAILGILTSILRYVIMEQRKSSMKAEKVHKLNSIALYAGCLAFLGLIYLALNPVGFPTTDKQDYIWNVGVTHNVGAFGALICFDVYIFIQLYLSGGQGKGNASIHRYLAIPIFTTSITIVLIFYFVAEDFLSKIADEETGLFALPKLQYTFFPLVTAVLEWIFGLSVFIFLSTFARDFKDIKVVFQLQPKHTPTKNGITSKSDAVATNGQSVGNGLYTTSLGKTKKEQ